MDPTIAKNRLKRMVAWEAEPTLSEGEIDDLLEIFRVPDAAGILPGETGWEPTYRLNAAAAEGWTWKAGKASEMISVDLDDERMSANQIFEHCERMAQRYKRKISGTITVKGHG